MTLLPFPRFLSIPFSSNPRQRNRCCVCALSAETIENRGGSAILWFKHDLRLDDHPALVAAAKAHRSVLPLYVFDHRILSRYSEEVLELVLFALEDLRKSLKEQGSNLMIRFGKAEHVIAELVKEVRATNIFAEVEAEYEMHEMIKVVKKNLEKVTYVDGNPKIVLWQTPFYDIKNLKDLPASYDDFRKLKLRQTLPLLPPTLPVVEMELDWGLLPSFDDLKDFMSKKQCKTTESWSLTKEISGETVLQKKLSKPLESSRKKLSFKHFEKKRPDNSVFLTRKGNIVAGGTTSVLNALAAYLRYLEGTARDDWQEYVLNLAPDSF